MTERGGVDMTTDITTGITSGTTLDIIMGTTAGREDIAAPEWGRPGGFRSLRSRFPGSRRFLCVGFAATENGSPPGQASLERRRQAAFARYRSIDFICAAQLSSCIR